MYKTGNRCPGVLKSRSSQLSASAFFSNMFIGITLVCVMFSPRGQAQATPPLNNGVALTPPMGWNSWNRFWDDVSTEKIKQTIDFMVSSGLRDSGYNFVIIDDGWSLHHRSGQSTNIVKTAEGAIQLYNSDGSPHNQLDGGGIDPSSGHLIVDASKFPDAPSLVHPGTTVNGIQWLAEYAHQNHMKLGIYTAATYLTCGGAPGSLGHESIDAADFVTWGIDYVKMDNCPAGPPVNSAVGTQGQGLELTSSLYARVQTFQKALSLAFTAAGTSQVVLSVSGQPGQVGVSSLLSPNDPARSDSRVMAAMSSLPATTAPGNAPFGVWCGQVSNLCRVDGDRSGDYNGILNAAGNSLSYPKYSQPGGWGDLDMLWAGFYNTNTPLNPVYSAAQSQGELSIAAELASPLISGADFRLPADAPTSAIAPSMLRYYLNKDVIAIDQDSLGAPAKLVGGVNPRLQTGYAVISRALANGDVALLFVNNNKDSVTVTPTVTLADLGLSGASYAYKDLWANTSESAPTNPVSITGTLGSSISVTLPPSGVAMYRIYSGNSGSSCTPTPIIPYIQVNGQSWQSIAAVTVPSGSSVNLGPQPIGGTWNWVGPNGFTSTAREIDNIPLMTGANAFTATYADANGCRSTQTFNIAVTENIAVTGNIKASGDFTTQGQYTYTPNFISAAGTISAKLNVPAGTQWRFGLVNLDANQEVTEQDGAGPLSITYDVSPGTYNFFIQVTSGVGSWTLDGSHP